MNVTTPIKDDFNDWLRVMPEVEGVRPLDRLPATTQTQTYRPTYRRQLPPTEKDDRKRGQQQIISLVREGGVLRWRAGAAIPIASMRRAGMRAALPAGEVVKQYAYEALETSKVYDALVKLDSMLTPEAAYAGNKRTGLRLVRNGKLEPLTTLPQVGGKRVLVFIHGTFSKSEALINDGLALTQEGRDLVGRAEKDYQVVLAYDHPTLSVSPIMNAFDLAALLRPTPAALDIICHSRGGLVARWLCEAYCDPALKRRVVFVGAPLAGTSLAAAPRLRSTLDLLTNIADVLRTAAGIAAANPFFLAASGLLRVVSTVTNLAAKTPMFDVALALIPGLDAQSRTGNNEEIRRLRQNTGSGNFGAPPVEYFAIRSNFEPEAIGWNFLRLFSKPMQRLGDLGADIIFKDENDLVVDTSSMSEVADSRLVKIVHDFGKSDTVHHTNYFVQKETAEAIAKALNLVTT
jgi:pimeloyl-ACP methyl ester carboxylesterase